MKRLAMNCLKSTVALFILGTGISFGQAKAKQTFDVNSDVAININSTYVTFELETWNKDKVQIEASIEGGDLTKEERKELMDAWDFSVTSSKRALTIDAHGGLDFNWENMPDLSGLESLENIEVMTELGALSELGPMLTEMLTPMLENIAKNPLPPDFMNGLEGLEFDYDAYEKDNEAYMKQWEAELKERFGDDYEVKMEAWGEEYGAQWEAWGEEFGEKFGEDMEAWGEEYGKKWEAWGEEFGEKFGEEMEAWGEEFGAEMEKWAAELEKWEEENPNANGTFIINGDDIMGVKGAKRVIKIKMPKDAKLDLNIRHGEVKLGDAYNIKADLNYTTFLANTVDGGETSINAAYAPVYIKHWAQGQLNTSYVETCVLNKATLINMDSKSSNVTFGVISGDAVLSGSYGALVINNLSQSFDTLALTLDNTDANIFLPEVDFDLFFNGKKSSIKAPDSVTFTTKSSSNSGISKGFYINKNSSRSININASYSEVTMH